MSDMAVPQSVHFSKAEGSVQLVHSAGSLAVDSHRPGHGAGSSTTADTGSTTWSYKTDDVPPSDAGGGDTKPDEIPIFPWEKRPDADTHPTAVQRQHRGAVDIDVQTFQSTIFAIGGTTGMTPELPACLQGRQTGTAHANDVIKVLKKFLHDVRSEIGTVS